MRNRFAEHKCTKSSLDILGGDMLEQQWPRMPCRLKGREPQKSGERSEAWASPRLPNPNSPQSKLEWTQNMMRASSTCFQPGILAGMNANVGYVASKPMAS